MLENFITAFVIMLAQEEKVTNVKISDDILEYLVKSEEDFTAIQLKFDDIRWILPLDNGAKREELVVKIIDVTNFI
jgi:hypothetical protein